MDNKNRLKLKVLVAVLSINTVFYLWYSYLQDTLDIMEWNSMKSIIFMQNLISVKDL